MSTLPDAAPHKSGHPVEGHPVEGHPVDRQLDTRVERADIRIERGTPDDQELAALVAVLDALATAGPAPAGQAPQASPARLAVSDRRPRLPYRPAGAWTVR